jgi:hypothetical protein
MDFEQPNSRATWQHDFPAANAALISRSGSGARLGT